MEVKIKKVRPHADIPQYATDGAAGFDLVAAEDVVISPDETKIVPTGIAVELPPGYEMQIRPRSGVSLKTKLRVANAPGTVDSDYRGEIGIIVDNTSDSETKVVKRGTRIAQGVIQRVERAEFVVCDELTETARGDGGFGSTGNLSDEDLDESRTKLS